MGTLRPGPIPLESLPLNRWPDDAFRALFAMACASNIPYDGPGQAVGNKEAFEALSRENRRRSLARELKRSYGEGGFSPSPTEADGTFLDSEGVRRDSED